MTAGLAHSGLWAAAGTIAVVVLVWLALRKGGFEYGLAAVLVGGILVAPHVYLSDCAMALPALLITMPLVSAPWQRYFHLFLLSPLCSVWGLIGPAWITGLSLIAYLVWIAFAKVAAPSGPLERRPALLDSLKAVPPGDTREISVCITSRA